MSTHYPSRAEGLSKRFADGLFAGGAAVAVLAVAAVAIRATVDGFGERAAAAFFIGVGATVVSVFVATIRWSERDRP